MGFFVGKELGPNRYKPSVLTSWLIPKGASGNTYNGLGDTKVSRARPQMHGPEKHPWTKVVAMFLFRTTIGSPVSAVASIKHMWREKFGHIDIAAQRQQGTPESFTAALKEEALKHAEVEIVGIARMREEWRFQGHDDIADLPWIVVTGRSMDYEALAKNMQGDFSSALAQVIGGYEKTQSGAVHIANWIRERGYYAKGYGGLSSTKGEWHLAIPPAIEAGIGQLAKNGSMINDSLGSAFRVATVLTDMPLLADAPREMGVDEFCMSCQKCQTDCPPGAISNEKQMVRGVEKWYVDFDKCMPYMAEHKGCAICLSTCPWSRPGIAPSLSQKMLKKMSRRAENIS